MKAPKQPSRPKQSHIDVKLSKQSLQAWQQTTLNYARLRGIAADLTAQTKLERLLVQEQNNLLQLWEAFTTQRSDLQRYLVDPKKQASVYLLGFHLANQARAQGILNRWLSRLPLAQCQSIASSSQRLFDFGCGSAAMSLGWLESMRRYQNSQSIPQRDLTLIDSRGAFLDVARNLLKQFDQSLELTSIKCDLQDIQAERLLSKEGPAEQIQVAFLGYVWNELLRSPKAMQRLGSMIETLSQARTIIVFLEPANQQLSRQAMEFRDQLRDYAYEPQYPCVAPGGCPMLERTRDWCYSELTWQQPGIAKKVDKILNTDRQQLNTTGFVFVSQGLRAALQAVDASDERQPQQVVVGRPLIKSQRGGKRFDYLVCDGQAIRTETPKSRDSFIQRGRPY